MKEIKMEIVLKHVRIQILILIINIVMKKVRISNMNSKMTINLKKKIDFQKKN